MLLFLVFLLPLMLVNKDYHYAPPIVWRSVDGRRLSVRLSVCPVPDPKSRTKGHRKLKIGGKEAHDTGDP